MSANRGKLSFECQEDRYCFAYLPLTGLCGILDGNQNLVTGEVMAPYEKGKCPFCKPEQSVTNGVYYPTPRDLKMPKERRKME